MRHLWHRPGHPVTRRPVHRYRRRRGGTDELFAFIAKTVSATGTVGDSDGGQTIDISFTGPEDEDQDPVMMVEEVGGA